MQHSISGYSIRGIFDPIQTLAVYGVRKEDVPTIKNILKKQGATRFRIVKTNVDGMVIVCFKMKG